MAPNDEIEEEILRVLRETDSLSFNEIVEILEGKMPISSPKLSRRLRHLVDLGLIRRDIIDDWPPRSSYSIHTKTRRKGLGLTTRARNPRASLVLFFVLGIALASIIVAYLLEREKVDDLSTLADNRYREIIALQDQIQGIEEELAEYKSDFDRFEKINIAYVVRSLYPDQPLNITFVSYQNETSIDCS